MKQGLVRLLYNFGKRFMGWTLHMIMCVLLCYPVSIRIYYQQGILFLVIICNYTSLLIYNLPEIKISNNFCPTYLNNILPVTIREYLVQTVNLRHNIKSRAVLGNFPPIRTPTKLLESMFPHIRHKNYGMFSQPNLKIYPPWNPLPRNSQS